MFSPIFISVPSQVIVGRTISKKQMLMSVSTKIAIQLNCKLGGEAWALEIPVSVGFSSRKLLGIAFKISCWPFHQK